MQVYITNKKSNEFKENKKISQYIKLPLAKTYILTKGN